MTYKVSSTLILINEEQEMLLVKRNAEEDLFPGKWTVPGGKLEDTDVTHRKPDTSQGHYYNAVKESLRREVQEEVGITFSSPKYLTSMLLEGQPASTLILSFYTDQFSFDQGKVILNDEHTDYAWVTATEAQSYDTIAGIQGELEKVKENMA